MRGDPPRAPEVVLSPPGVQVITPWICIDNNTFITHAYTILQAVIYGYLRCSLTCWAWPYGVYTLMVVGLVPLSIRVEATRLYEHYSHHTPYHMQTTLKVVCSLGPRLKKNIKRFNKI